MTPDPVTLAPKGAIANAERAIEMAKGLRIGLLEKPFYNSPEVPAIIARFALPSTDPVDEPTRREVSGRPTRLLAHQRGRSAGSEAAAADRRAVRMYDAFEEAAVRAADATSRLWDARCVSELERVEAGMRAEHLRAEQRALEEIEAARGDDEGSDEESEGVEVLAVIEMAEVTETEQRVDETAMQPESRRNRSTQRAASARKRAKKRAAAQRDSDET